MEDLLKHITAEVERQGQQLAAQEILTGHLAKQADRLEKELSSIRESVHRIEVLAASRSGIPVCAAPNLCLDLKRQMEALTANVQSLADARSEAKGALKVAVLVATIAGSLGGAIIALLAPVVVSLFHIKTHTP
jgi:hypothetical protein